MKVTIYLKNELRNPRVLESRLAATSFLGSPEEQSYLQGQPFEHALMTHITRAFSEPSFENRTQRETFFGIVSLDYDRLKAEPTKPMKRDLHTLKTYYTKKEIDYEQETQITPEYLQDSLYGLGVVTSLEEATVWVDSDGWGDGYQVMYVAIPDQALRKQHRGLGPVLLTCDAGKAMLRGGGLDGYWMFCSPTGGSYPLSGSELLKKEVHE